MRGSPAPRHLGGLDRDQWEGNTADAAATPNPSPEGILDAAESVRRLARTASFPALRLSETLTASLPALRQTSEMMTAPLLRVSREMSETVTAPARMLREACDAMRRDPAVQAILVLECLERRRRRVPPPRRGPARRRSARPRRAGSRLRTAQGGGGRDGPGEPGEGDADHLIAAARAAGPGVRHAAEVLDLLLTRLRRADRSA